MFGGKSCETVVPKEHVGDQCSSFWGVVCRAYFRMGSRTNAGTMLVVFLGVFGVVRDVFSRTSQNTSKVCLDCADAYGLRARPPRGRWFLLVVESFCVAMFIDFGLILVYCWRGFEVQKHSFGVSVRGLFRRSDVLQM